MPKVGDTTVIRGKWYAWCERCNRYIRIKTLAGTKHLCRR